MEFHKFIRNVQLNCTGLVCNHCKHSHVICERANFNNSIHFHFFLLSSYRVCCWIHRVESLILYLLFFCCSNDVVAFLFSLSSHFTLHHHTQTILLSSTVNRLRVCRSLIETLSRSERDFEKRDNYSDFKHAVEPDSCDT